MRDYRIFESFAQEMRRLIDEEEGDDRDPLREHRIEAHERKSVGQQGSDQPEVK